MKLSQISFAAKNLPYNHKNVTIEYGYALPGEAGNELYRAQDVIGNYAKAHNKNVKFFDARQFIGDFGEPTLEDMIPNKIGIKVTDKASKMNKFDYINYYDNAEKPFLRRVYESLQRLVEGKQSPIEAHKKETIQKLIKAGKIKA